MTSSPDLIHELRASRPSAPADLRARVRTIAAEQPARAPWASWRFPVRRGMLVAVPAAAALALASAGVVGLARSDSPQAVRQDALEKSTLEAATAVGDGRPSAPGRAQTPVRDDHGRPRAARERDAHGRGEGRRRRLARRAERTRAHAVARRLRRLVLGRDRRRGKRLDHGPRPGRRGAGRDHRSLRPRPHRLAAGHDRRPAGEHRRRAAPELARSGRRSRVVTARLESGTLDAETQARLEARLKNLKADLLAARRNLGARARRRGCRRSSSRS